MRPRPLRPDAGTQRRGGFSGPVMRRLAARTNPQPFSSTSHKRDSVLRSLESRNQRRGGARSHLLNARSSKGRHHRRATCAQPTDRLAQDGSFHPTGRAADPAALRREWSGEDILLAGPLTRPVRTGLGEGDRNTRPFRSRSDAPEQLRRDQLLRSYSTAGQACQEVRTTKWRLFQPFIPVRVIP